MMWLVHPVHPTKVRNKQHQIKERTKELKNSINSAAMTREVEKECAMPKNYTTIRKGQTKKERSFAEHLAAKVPELEMPPELAEHDLTELVSFYWIYWSLLIPSDQKTPFFFVAESLSEVCKFGHIFNNITIHWLRTVSWICRVPVEYWGLSLWEWDFKSKSRILC